MNGLVRGEERATTAVRRGGGMSCKKKKKKRKKLMSHAGWSGKTEVELSRNFFFPRSYVTSSLERNRRRREEILAREMLRFGHEAEGELVSSRWRSLRLISFRATRLFCRFSRVIVQLTRRPVRECRCYTSSVTQGERARERERDEQLKFSRRKSRNNDFSVEEPRGVRDPRSKNAVRLLPGVSGRFH